MNRGALIFHIAVAIALFLLGIFLGFSEDIAIPSPYGSAPKHLQPPATYFISALPLGMGALILIKLAHFGYCAECGEPLFNRRIPLSTKDIQPSWECPSHDVLEIFEKAARPGMTVNGWFDACWFIRSMAASADHGRENSHLTGELRELLREFGRNWKGNCRLISLRRLAYLMNMSLYELLTCSGTAYRLSYDVLNIQSLPEHLKRRKKTVRNHKHVYRKLVAYLEEQQIPPSLKQAARFAQVSPGYLEYRFPSLVRRIVDRYQAHRYQTSLVNRYRAQTAALQFFIDDRYADHTQSRKEAYRVLKEETGLPKWVLKTAIQTAYSALVPER